MDQTALVDLARDIDQDLAARLSFVLEIDKLKGVMRRNRLVDGSRPENTAEHSWHLAMMALVFAPMAGADVDVMKAITMLLVHDVVEIDAGDTYIHDEDGRSTKKQREQAAAERLFNLLPADEAPEIARLWDEYEDRATPTARYAAAVDKLQPLLLNAASGGRTWSEHDVGHDQAMAANSPIAVGSPPLWDLAQAIIGRATDHGLLIDDRPTNH